MEDQQQQVCVDPAMSPVAAPAASPAPLETPAPLAPYAPANANDQPPASANDQAAPFAHYADPAPVGPTGGDLAKFASNVGKVMTTGMGAPGEIGGVASLPADAMNYAKGLGELNKGDLKNGIPDAVTGGAGVVKDVATIAGDTPLGQVAGGVKGVAEVGKGVTQLVDAATAKPLEPGQSGIDTDSKTLDGVENVIKGAGDFAAALPGPAGKVGKAFNAGMAAGNLIAPVVFGSEDEANRPHVESAVNADGTDRNHQASTGNDTIDSIFFLGKSREEANQAHTVSAVNADGTDRKYSGWDWLTGH